MAEIKGVDFIQGDITEENTFAQIMELMPSNEKADLVVCDGAPDVTGFHDIDFYVQSQLLVAALNIGLHSLRPGGTFISKIFRGNHDFFLFSQFKIFFGHVELYKPHSSRESSAEHFVVCRFYNPPKDFGLKFVSTFLKFDERMVREGADLRKNKFIFEYLDCGDLSYFGSVKEEGKKGGNSEEEERQEEVQVGKEEGKGCQDLDKICLDKIEDIIEEDFI